MMRISCALAFLVACHAAPAVDWGYANSAAGIATCTAAKRCGPAQWGLKYPVCKGVGDQSPIDAPYTNGGYLLPGSSIDDLTFNAPKACTSFNRIWNTHGLVVQPCADSLSVMYGQGVPKVKFSLSQFNFHSPSEHTVDGAYYPLETHFVLKDTSAKTIIIAVFATADKAFETECLAMAGKPATEQTLACQQAYFFDSLLHNYVHGANTLTDAAFQTHIKTAAATDQQVFATTTSALVAPKSIDAWKYFMPDMSKTGTNYFFTYVGSLTTPPCSTSVSWILNPTVVTVYYSSLTLYRTIADLYPSNQLKTAPVPELTLPAGAATSFDWVATQGYSNRPVQALGARKFYYVGTLPPWDSSKSLASSSGTSSLSLQKSSNSAESDSGSGSYASSGSNRSGSSGSFMAVWKWTLLLTCCLCCLLGACIAAFCQKPKPKPKPAPKPAPEPEPIVEEPLLPPLMPVTTAVPSYAMPITTAMPATYAMPATTAYSQPTYSQLQPAYTTPAYSTPAFSTPAFGTQPLVMESVV